MTDKDYQMLKRTNKVLKFPKEQGRLQAPNWHQQMWAMTQNILKKLA